MTVLITLTVAGTDSGPYDLYTELDGYITPFETGVSKASLLGGYSSSLVPDYAKYIRVKSTGICVENITITLANTTTTTSSTTSTTTTIAPVYNANTNGGVFFDTEGLACAAPLNTILYVLGDQYFYDPGFTNAVYSDILFFKFVDDALRTANDGTSTGAFSCNP